MSAVKFLNRLAERMRDRHAFGATGKELDMFCRDKWLTWLQGIELTNFGRKSTRTTRRVLLVTNRPTCVLGPLGPKPSVPGKWALNSTQGPCERQAGGVTVSVVVSRRICNEKNNQA